MIDEWVCLQDLQKFMDGHEIKKLHLTKNLKVICCFV